MTKLAKNIFSYRTITLLQCLFAAWLMAGYLLPKTVWGHFAAPRPFWSGVPLPVCAIMGTLVCVFILVALALRHRKGAAWALCGLCLTYIGIRAFFAVHDTGVKYSLLEFVLIAVPLGTGLMSAALCISPSRIFIIMTSLGTLQAVYTLVLYFMRTNILWSGDTARAGGTFAQPTAVYTIMLFCIPLAASLMLGASNHKRRLLWAACTAIMFMSLILTWYRGPMLGIMVAMAWLICRLGSRRATTFVVTALVLLLCYGVVQYVRTAGSNSLISASASEYSRYYIWHYSWTSIARHPIFGIGPGRVHIPVHSATIATTYVLSEPKNLLLLWLMEFGLVGALALILLAYTTCQIISRDATNNAAAIAASWIGICVAGFTDTPFGVTDRAYANALLGILIGATLLLNNYTVSPTYSLTAKHILPAIALWVLVSIGITIPYAPFINPIDYSYPFVYSPNCDLRPRGIQPSCVVLHATANSSEMNSMNEFRDPDSHVSAHFLVSKSGTVIQFVPITDRAWHAGESLFGGVSDVNNYSVGIEMVNKNDGVDSYTDAQYHSVANIIRLLRKRYQITDDRIISHAQIALPAGRKSDPRGFDFRKLHEML